MRRQTIEKWVGGAFVRATVTDDGKCWWTVTTVQGDGVGGANVTGVAPTVPLAFAAGVAVAEKIITA